jgi:hypothetical protein
MALPLHHLRAIALRTLGEDERRRTAVYLDPRVHAAGSTVAAGRQRIQVPQPSLVAFIDLSPGANWGHPCRYLLIDAESGAVESLDAQFPPPQDALRLLYRSEDIQDWMLLTQEQA